MILGDLREPCNFILKTQTLKPEWSNCLPVPVPAFYPNACRERPNELPSRNRQIWIINYLGNSLDVQ